MAIKRVWRLAIVLVVVCVAVVALYVYMFGYVECPWCYPYRDPPFSDIADRPFHLAHKLEVWAEMTEEEKRPFTGNPGLYVTECCPWCGGTGAMRRIDLFLKRRASEE